MSEDKMERIKNIKCQLLSAIENQINNIEKADSKELGEAVDMLKDLSEYCYYTTITEAMEEKSNSENMEYINEYLPETRMYYSGRPPRMYYRMVIDIIVVVEMVVTDIMKMNG